MAVARSCEHELLGRLARPGRVDLLAGPSQRPCRVVEPPSRAQLHLYGEPAPVAVLHDAVMLRCRGQPPRHSASTMSLMVASGARAGQSPPSSSDASDTSAVDSPNSERGLSPPQSTGSAPIPTAATAPLNEGEGFHPRNPGPRVAGPAARVVRSMKAGAFTPAIHVHRSHHRQPIPGRSMKAGAFTPAILPSVRLDRRRHERSMKAGAFTPAIPSSTRRPRCSMPRSMKAGAFTPAIRVGDVHRGVGIGERSMKAGAFTPAIRVIHRGRAGQGRRSMKAGAFTPAIPVGVPFRAWQPGDRSMKAGAFTPAIHGARVRLGVIHRGAQ